MQFRRPFHRRWFTVDFHSLDVVDHFRIRHLPFDSLEVWKLKRLRVRSRAPPPLFHPLDYEHFHFFLIEH